VFVCATHPILCGPAIERSGDLVAILSTLSEGEVLCESREIECWKHGSAFSLITGEPVSERRIRLAAATADA